MKFVNDFNLKKQAEDLGVKIWQTPGFLFVIMGIVTVVIMAVTFFISKNYDDPQILIISECLVVTIIMIVGTSIVRMVEQIARLNKIKGEFVSVASHQLRTPLSAIRWETEILLGRSKSNLSQKQLENINNIANLSRRMTRLVNDLLDVARIDQGRLILRKQKLNLMDLTQDVLKEILPSVKSRNIELASVSKKNLPAVIGDPEKIKLAIENLISNAIKYTVSGGKIEIKIFKKGHRIIFEIKDNGVGIPEEQLGRVFEKFFRSSNAAKYQTEGTGLGLYIAKNIVEQLGGSIWFQSIENVGSLFSFSLPVAGNKENSISKSSWQSILK
jgi:signal transduction histidine kinase